MAKAKKGSIKVIACECPACKANLLVDDEGNVLRSFYEPDKEKAEEIAKEFIDEQTEEENGEAGTGGKTVQDDDKEEMENKDSGKGESGEAKNDKKDSGFSLGDW